MAQTEHPQMYWETSRAILYHQNRGASERVRWLPGYPEPRGSMQGAQKGNPQGVGHVGFALWASQRSGFGDEAMRIGSSRAHRMGLTRTA